MKKTLLLRADGNERIGTGHLMRSLALAQAWFGCGGAAFFALASPSGAMEGRLKSEGMKTTVLNAKAGTGDDARKTVALARRIGASWIVTDGYAFDADYARRIRTGGVPLAMIDDNGLLERYEADIVINANLYAEETSYRNRDGNVRLLLGGRYALIRGEFQQRRTVRRTFSAKAGRILLTLGGSDPLGLTPAAIRAVRRLEAQDIEVRVIVGPANPNEKRCREEMCSAPFRGSLISAAKDMAEQMIWADIAVAASGSTCWEMACLGLPAVLIVTAENQVPIAASLHEAGIAVNLGRPSGTMEARIAASVRKLLSDPERRKSMSRLGRKCIDGRGAERVVHVLMDGQPEGKGA